jgi:vitamin B12 transporter
VEVLRTGIVAGYWSRVPDHPVRPIFLFILVQCFCSIRPAGKRPVVYSREKIMTTIVSSRIQSALLAAAAASTTIAFAQGAPDKTMGAVTVTATRTPQQARDVLTDNIVITSEEIAKSGPGSLIDLLQRKRGIEIARNGGPGTVSSLFMRGTNANHVVVLIDGVRSSSSTAGGTSWQSLPLAQIDRIEIGYGPLSTLYGADAVGGVVQIFTRKGSGAPHVSAAVGVGSFGLRTADVGFSGSTDDEHRFTYAISAGREQTNGFSATKRGNFSFNPDDDGYTKDSASGRFSFDVTKGHELGLTFLQSRLDTAFDNGASTFDARNVGRIGSVAVYSKNQFLPNWLSTLQLAQSTDKLESITSATPALNSRFDTTQNLYSWQNDVTLGTDLLQLVLERREEKVDSTTVAVANSRYTNAAAASYLLKRGAHLASFAIRQDRSSQFDATTTGSIGYGYRITDALRANASYGTSFRAPTFNELYFPQFGLSSIQPEKGKNAEVGMYYDDGKTQASAAYYQNRITNLIVTANPCPAAGLYPFGCAYNVNRARINGLTLGASTRIDAFKLSASLDLQDPRDETTDKQLARRAREHGTMALDYVAGAVAAGGELVFSGKRFDTAANTNVLAGYGVVNLYATYDFARDWQVLARWNNVLNRDYEVASTYATPKSNLFVGLRYGFK